MRCGAFLTACGDAAAECCRRMANLLPERMSSGAKAAAVRARRGAADISVLNESIAALLTTSVGRTKCVVQIVKKLKEFCNFRGTRNQDCTEAGLFITAEIMKNPNYTAVQI